METGINLFCYNDEISIDRQIELMRQNDFKNTFMLSDCAELTDETIGKLRTADITLATLHAPFRGINEVWRQGESGDKVLEGLLDGVRKCEKYNIPVLVVHLSSKYPPPMITDIGVQRFKRLMEVAKASDIIIAYENQRCLSNIALALEQFENARFCWDTGHEGCFTSGWEYMPLFGDKLATVHIHDNFGVKDSDDHLLPYDGTLDFGKVTKYIAKANYDGCIMLEVFRGNSNQYDDITDEEYYARAAVAANRLANEVEILKKQWT